MPRRRIAALGLQSVAMDTATAGSGLKWVGRAIRRLEDPALVRGRGRFTADLPAAHFVRFVRSPVAAGRVVRISAPEGVAVIRASDLGAQPIKPMLHKYNYRPIEQPILADEVVRFVGEPIAAVVAPTPAQADAAAVHATGNLIVDGQFKTAGFDAALTKAHRRVRLAAQSRRQNATPLEARAAHASFEATWAARH